jgi:hypothetical protein
MKADFVRIRRLLELRRGGGNTPIVGNPEWVDGIPLAFDIVSRPCRKMR